MLGERDADGVLVGGAAKFDTFLREVQALAAKGNQTFVEARSLRPEVAGLIDAYHAQAEALRGTGDVNSLRAPLEPAAALELQALDQEMHRLLTEPSSWRPAGASASEANSTLKENGVELVLKLTARGEASASRALVTLAAEPDSPEPLSRPASPSADAAPIPSPDALLVETPAGSRAATPTATQAADDGTDAAIRARARSLMDEIYAEVERQTSVGVRSGPIDPDR